MKTQSFISSDKNPKDDANDRGSIKNVSIQGVNENPPGAPHPGFLSPSFLMRETKVLGLILSNSAAPPGP